MTVDVAEVLPERLVIGVLALQGAFIEHMQYLERLRIRGHVVSALAVRNPEELSRCHALVIPGGESTAITRVAARTEGMLPALQAFVSNPAKPVYGTCAGMILMADTNGVGGGKRKNDGGAWGGIPGLRVWRNLYGGQLESFECPLDIDVLSNPTRPFNAIFIRAPAVHSLSPGTEVDVIASLPPDCVPAPPPPDEKLGPADVSRIPDVMLRQGRRLVTSFHPELSGDTRIHEYWVEKCVLGRD